MKLDVIAAFAKRFNKVDEKINKLCENIAGRGRDIALINDEIANLLKSIPEDKSKQFAEELIKLNRNVDSLNSSHKGILLQETPKLLKGEPGVKGDKGDPGESIKGDDGRGIEKIFINFNKHWIIIYTDGTRVDLGKIVSETIYQGGGGGGISINEVRRLLRDGYVPYTGAIQSLDMGENDVIIKGNAIYEEIIHARGTGLHDGGVVSINALDGSKIDYTEGEAYFVDNYTTPSVATLIKTLFAAGTSVTITNIATANQTYLAIDVNGDLIQQATPFTSAQFREYAILGLVRHYDRVNIDAVFPLAALGYDTPASLQDLMLVMGVINYSGNIFSAASTNLTIARSAGELFRQGSNYLDTAATRKAPNFTTTLAESPVLFRYRYQDGLGAFTQSVSDLTSIDPNYYDDGTGTLALVGGSKWTIQPVYFIQNSTSITRIFYGQDIYTTLSRAENGIFAGARLVDEDATANLSLRGWWLLRNGATDLSDIAQAKFIQADKFGEATAGGASTSTTSLQEAYNNSLEPEILTNSTLGALSLKRGSAADTDNVLEIQNNAGGVTFNVDGNGNIISGTWSALFGIVSGANLTFLTPENISAGTAGINITGNAATASYADSAGVAATVTTNANLTGAVTSIGNATSLGSFTSAQLATALTNETGSGAAVFGTSPTLITPALGTPSSLVGTNISGTATNLTAGNATVAATVTTAASTDTTASIGLFNSATGNQAAKTSPLISANAATGAVSLGTDTDVKHILGRAAAGFIGYADIAGFGHLDHATTSGYALLQNSAGSTVVNAPTGQSTNLAINGATKLQVASSGAILTTSQPAFSVYNSVTRTNVLGDGTTYTIPYNVVVHDNASEFDNTTGIYTASVSGKRNFFLSFLATNISSTHVSATVTLATSNGSYAFAYVNPYAKRPTGNYWTESFSVIGVPMDALDTAYVSIWVSGSSKTISLTNNAVFIKFSGELTWG